MRRKYLTPDGKQDLKNDLDESPQPIDIINDLGHYETIDSSFINPFYGIIEHSQGTTEGLFSRAFENLLIEAKKSVDKMSTKTLPLLLQDLELFSAIPEFSDLIAYSVAKLPEVPKSMQLPSVVIDQLSPLEQSRVFCRQEDKFEEWINSVFNRARTNIKDDFDFSYLALFDTIGSIVFHQPTLVENTLKFIEKKFHQGYHPMYSMTRLRMALYDSPLSKIDTSRPFAAIIANSQQGKVIKPEIFRKCFAICDKNHAHMLLTIPHMTITSSVEFYASMLDVPKEDVPKWIKMYANPDQTFFENMKSTAIFPRICAIYIIQKGIVDERVLNALANTPAQIDIGKIMCRRYKKEYYNILYTWSMQNSDILIDFVTKMKAIGSKIPAFNSMPKMNKAQKQIFELLKKK